MGKIDTLKKAKLNLDFFFFLTNVGNKSGEY